MYSHKKRDALPRQHYLGFYPGGFFVKVHRRVAESAKVLGLTNFKAHTQCLRPLTFLCVLCDFAVNIFCSEPPASLKTPRTPSAVAKGYGGTGGFVFGWRLSGSERTIRTNSKPSGCMRKGVLRLWPAEITSFCTLHRSFFPFIIRCWTFDVHLACPSPFFAFFAALR